MTIHLTNSNNTQTPVSYKKTPKAKSSNPIRTVASNPINPPQTPGSTIITRIIPTATTTIITRTPKEVSIVVIT